MATIYDVARMAGVSIATVSRVLNGSPRVTPPLRQRVLRAAQELGYRPNRLARALAEGRLNALGLMLPSDISHPFYNVLAENVARCATEEGYEVVVGLPTQATTEGYLKAASDLQDRRLQGLLLCANADTVRACVAGRPPASPPLVAVGCLPVVQAPLVTGDEATAGYQVTQHLLSLGHEHIAFLGQGAGDVRPTGRESGYHRAMREAGLAGIFRAEDKTMAGGRRGATKLLATYPDLTALVAHNDAMALGALRGLHEAGRRVPEDFSAVGFDNVPQSEYSLPALTTVELPAAQMARQAVDMLIGLIEEQAPADPPRVMIPPRLVVRESSGPPPVN